LSAILKAMQRGIALLLILLGTFPACHRLAEARPAQLPFDSPQYQLIKQRLLRGWGSWDARNVLGEVLLPQGLAVSVGLKQITWIGNEYLDHAIIGLAGPEDPHVRPGLHALDGSYSECELKWRNVDVRITTATVPGDGNGRGPALVMLIEPLRPSPLPTEVFVRAGLLWNRPGSIIGKSDSLEAELGSRSIGIYVTGRPIADPYAHAVTPYLALRLSEPIGISTASPRSLNAIRAAVSYQKQRLLAQGKVYGDLSETYLAMESVLAWNTIYEPRFDRVVTTVGRIWDRDYGGYCLFGWDNFFLSYLTALYSRDLAFANFIEHLRSTTDQGFIPNDDRGNGAKSWDRSQPPVGALMLKEIYKRYPERWLLRVSFPSLLRWNRWWFKARLNDGLLSYGSSLAKNPYHEPDTHTVIAAGYESGMDDSPMYEGVPFDKTTSTLELQDVGLNSLYIADCRALAEIANLLGDGSAAAELTARANLIAQRMASLWSPSVGLYLNRRTDSGQLSPALSPTVFFPLLAGLVTRKRAQEMVEKHLMNPAEFYRPYMIPSISRDNADFPRQRYWKGAVWPPLNFIVYVGLRKYGFDSVGRELARTSDSILLRGWDEHGIVSENYSAITGTGDDPRLSSDPFHSWGALMGIMSMIQSGAMPPPEAPLVR
jgi:putative isomerase